MECLGGTRFRSFLTLFTRATPGTPASIINKTQTYIIHLLNLCLRFINIMLLNI